MFIQRSVIQRKFLTAVGIYDKVAGVVSFDDAVLDGGALVGVVRHDAQRDVPGRRALGDALCVGGRDEDRRAVILIQHRHPHLQYTEREKVSQAVVYNTINLYFTPQENRRKENQTAIWYVWFITQ